LAVTEEKAPDSGLGRWLRQVSEARASDLEAVARLLAAAFPPEGRDALSQVASSVAAWLQVPSSSDVALADGGAATERLSVQVSIAWNVLPQDDPNWVQRNRLITAMIIIMSVVVASPFYQGHVPPEIMTFLHEDYGSFTFCTSLSTIVFGGMAVYRHKKNKDN
jgi:hypothetical protein